MKTRSENVMIYTFVGISLTVSCERQGHLAILFSLVFLIVSPVMY